MNCSEARHKLAKQFQSRETINSDGLLAQHLYHCDLCQQSYTDIQLNNILGKIEVPAPRHGFVEQSIANAINSTVAAQASSLPRAAAAVVIFGALFTFIYSQYLATDANLNIASYPVRMAVNQVKNINVVIESDSYRADTSITLQLTDNMTIQGYEHTRELNWKTELLQGKNVITLPLIMHKSSGGFVNISYRSGANIGTVKVAISGA